MIIRHFRQSDSDEMFDAFKSVSLDTRDLSKRNVPKNGFFEYPLSFEEFRRRAESPLTLICERDNRIIAYMISYDVWFARMLKETGMADPVFDRIQGLESSIIYYDQLYTKPGLPAYIGARILHTADVQAENGGAPGVICAVPQSPWKNISSTRLAIMNGFAPQEYVKSGNVNLGIFTKPFLHLDIPFDGYGDNILL